MNSPASTASHSRPIWPWTTWSPPVPAATVCSCCRAATAPATLRTLPKVIDIANDFASSGIPIAAICHGPQILITARLLRGRHATCYKTVVDELKDAGALYEDKSVVVDGQFITSRQPDDLPDFMREVLKKVGA